MKTDEELEQLLIETMDADLNNPSKVFRMGYRLAEQSTQGEIERHIEKARLEIGRRTLAESQVESLRKELEASEAKYQKLVKGLKNLEVWLESDNEAFTGSHRTVLKSDIDKLTEETI